MSKAEIIQILISVHKKYSNARVSNETSQMCTLWSTSNPPDILEGTAPLNEIEEAINYGFYEEDAIEIYDKEIGDAADYIVKLLEKV